ncbi:PqqD family peptide modification chaperone [Zavarzinia sp. CC-PAN008]|uniref:PqqD family peptide modification chaperone n=1 Tax=Zavarzinia sp. CC-PAN008 TaxID=3243332 RepID=UPI003F7474ED
MPQPLTSDTTVELAPDLLEAEMDGETILLQTETGIYASLGETGSAIAALIRTPVRVSVLCERLQQDYDVDAATCVTDVLQFLDDLNAAGLLRVTP